MPVLYIQRSRDKRLTEAHGVFWRKIPCSLKTSNQVLCENRGKSPVSNVCAEMKTASKSQDAFPWCFCNLPCGRPKWRIAATTPCWNIREAGLLGLYGQIQPDSMESRLVIRESGQHRTFCAETCQEKSCPLHWKRRFRCTSNAGALFRPRSFAALLLFPPDSCMAFSM